jgi:acyl-CoA dehydrogenase
VENRQKRGLVDFTLTDAQHALLAKAQKAAGTWAGQALEIRRHGLEHGQYHSEFWRDYCAAGMMAPLVPTEFGGTGQGLLATVLAMEAFAARGLTPTLPVLTHAAARLITVAGSPDLRASRLPAIAEGSLLIGLAFTESEAGHNFTRMRTFARREGEHILISGEKSFISGVEIADRLLLVARSLTDEQRREHGLPTMAGFTAVLLDPQAEGVTLTEQHLGGREGLRQWRIEFDNVRAPAGEMVGAEHEAIAHLFDALNIERVLFTAIALGTTAHLLDLAVDHATSRTVFGDRPIGAYQAIAHPLARIRTQLEGARLLAYKAAALFDQGTDAVSVGAAANMAKLLAADVTHQAADQALQTFGAAGWDQDLGLIDHYLDARLFRSTPVSQELALNFVAENVLGLPKYR